MEGTAMEAYRAMIGTLKKKAMQELKLPEGEIIVRSLRPEDLGLTNPDWTFTITANSWNLLAPNYTVADNRFVGVNAVFVAESGEQAVTQLKVTSMGKDKRYWQIQGANFLQDQTEYFDDPITVDQNTPITIMGYAPSGTSDTAFRCIFLGAVAEKKGVLVS